MRLGSLLLARRAAHCVLSKVLLQFSSCRSSSVIHLVCLLRCHFRLVKGEEDEHPKYIICGPPPAVQYFGKFEKRCHWGNEVKLYEHHVDALFTMFWCKKPHIKYYVCTIKKTFAKPDQRMIWLLHLHITPPVGHDGKKSGSQQKCFWTL